MQKNNRRPFRRSERTAFIENNKGLKISKDLVLNSAIITSLVLVLSLLSFAVYGIVYVDGDASSGDTAAAVRLTPAVADSTFPGAIDYSRPRSIDEPTINSGGPFDDRDLTEDQAEADRQIKVIEAGPNKANLPSMWAHLGKINNEFGFRRNPFGGRVYEFHAGMDIDGERGDAVVAPANGVVTKAEWKGGYGQMVELDHGNGLKTRYGHLSRIEVTAGQVVTRGQLLGNVGSTGRSTGPHLHYELRLNDRPIDPRRLLPPEPAKLN